MQICRLVPPYSPSHTGACEIKTLLFGPGYFVFAIVSDAVLVSQTEKIGKGNRPDGGDCRMQKAEMGVLRLAWNVGLA
jgi:hypothetical protein